MNGKTLVYLFVILWLAVFVGSIVMTVNIEGPRNLDTGFKRLDVLARGQLIAIGLAILAAAAGFLVNGSTRRDKLIGLAPLALTIIIVLGGVLFALYATSRTPPEPNIPPNSKPAATAPVITTPSGD